MNILALIISPITWLMQTTLEGANALTHNYGTAIILMSVAINTILVPAYMLAERLQSKELRIRNRMQHKLDEFNAAFNGMNRFMYLKTLYRIHRYHPIMGLRSLGGIVIQIPFFIAAYQLLGHYEPFKQVPFLIIPDLLQPDALLTIGHIKINVLPLVMTAVNLLAADSYTKRKNPKAITQIWGLALVFLILLYNSPAALVIYWTMNNLYSWGKNILLMKYDAKHEHLQQTQVSPSTFQLLKEAYTRFLNNKQRVKTTVTALELLIGYLLAAYVLFNSDRARGIIPLQLLNVATLFGFIQAVLLFTIFLRYTSKHKVRYAITKYSVVIGLAICMGLLVYNIYTPLYIIANSLTFTIRKILICVVLLAIHSILFPWIRLYFRILPAHITTLAPFVKKSHAPLLTYITMCAALLFSIVLLIALPAEIYTSDPAAIGSPLEGLQGILFPLAIAVAFVLFMLYLLTPRTYKLYVSAVLYAMAIIVFAYTYLLPFDYGAINAFTMMNPSSIAISTPLFIVEGVLLVAAMLLAMHYISRKQGLFLMTIIGCIVFVLIRFGIAEVWYYTSKSKASSPQNTQEQTTNTKFTVHDQSKEAYNNVFKFSKNGKNIVVFFLDMFTGGLMQPIIASTPQVKRIYDGFVWYPNALSIAPYTTTSKPAMMGGWDFTPPNIGNVAGKNLVEKIARAYDDMFALYQSQGYAVASTGAVDSTISGGKRDISVVKWNNLMIEYWRRNNIAQKKSAERIVLTIPQRAYLLVAAGFIRALPFFIKQFAYDDSKWHVYNPQANRLDNWTVKDWAFLDSLVDVSSVDSPESTFKFFHNGVTHDPYILDSSCDIRQTKFPGPSDNSDTYEPPYYSARCAIIAIGKWITWLKKSGIYDNTKIIIISDHGSFAIEDPMNTNGVTLDLRGQTNTKSFSRAHIIFMVKDFNSRGLLQTDNRLVSNADLPAVMCDGLEHCNDLPQSPLLAEPPLERTLPTYDTPRYGNRDLMQDKRFKIKVQYKVTNNIFNQENWRRIQ